MCPDHAPHPKKIDAALALYDAALAWRASYYRTQIDAESIANAQMMYRYDACRTDFGDDAFDLLMDYTEPTE